MGFLTGSPSTSVNSSSSIRKPLNSVLAGLLNPNQDYNIKAPSGSAGKGGIMGALGSGVGAAFGGPAGAAAGGAAGNAIGGSGSSGASQNSIAQFLSDNPGVTRGKGNTFTSPTDITNLPKGWTESQNPNQASSLAALSLDPNSIKSEMSMLSQYSDPNYLNVSSNPQVQQMIKTLTDSSNLNLQQQLAQTRSRFAQQGQTSTGGSDPLLQAQTSAAGETQTGLNQTIAQQLFQQYQQNQQLQLQGVGVAQSLNMLPANLIASLGGLTGSAKGATASPLDSISKMVSAIGSVAGGAAMMCWVAREVYGEENPRWHRFRTWLLSKAPTWLRNWYAQDGERFAKWLRKHSWAKPPIRWAMNFVTRKEA